MRTASLAILAVIIVGNLLLWAVFNRPEAVQDWQGVIQGVSFSPYQDGQDPYQQHYPSRAEIDRDLTLLKGQVRRVRSYSSADGLEVIPKLAQQHGLRVTAGAWLDTRKAKNAEEIRNLIHNARHYTNVERLIVGNEALLRGDLSVAELTQYLRQVRAATYVPVSTAEPWHVWIKHPELAKEVDYIAIHVLPYWEGVPAEEAVTWALARYKQVKAAFPGKPVVFGEVGWPSDGNRFKHAQASLINQARFIREFLHLAQREGLDYFIMEAFDQNWKKQAEGTVGRHWGIYDVDRQPKFAMTGTVVDNPLWGWEAAVSALLAVLPITLFLLYWQHMRLRGQLFYAALLQTVMSVLSWTLFLPLTEDLLLLGQFIWGVLLPAQLALLAVTLINGLELSELLWARRKRAFTPATPTPATHLPKVSIHLPIHNEPPEMVKRTLDSLARLDYPDFEVLIIDNNTQDATVWQPVAEHCAQLGPRFRFFHLPKWPGYKAGALNFALQETHPAAEVIGVIDSDYAVRPDWLKSLVPHFAAPAVGFVQAPQDNREWQGDLFKTVCNWEYRGFFDTGMVHRNERDAIIQHGTMTLIRTQALRQLNGWSEWCICEDAELGLRLYESGYTSVYVNEDFGHGLVPESFAAYKVQRFRWAYGAMQILRGHWQQLWSPRSGLTLGQRFHFLGGWLPWIADALHLLFTFAAVFWTIGLVIWPQHFDFPLAAFLLPSLGMFIFKVTHSLTLYQTQVRCGLWERLGAAMAGMSLTHTIARAIWQGLFISGKPFFRTPKGENKPALMRALLMAWEELQMLGLLWLAIVATYVRYGDQWEALIWMLVLAAQSMPYLAALGVSLTNSVPDLHTLWTRKPASQAAVLAPAT